MSDFDDIVGPVEQSFPRMRHIKAKKRKMRPEDELHGTVAKFLTRIIAPAGWISEYEVMWFSIEMRNSGRTITTRNGTRVNLEGARRKAFGCISGVPDINIIYQGRYYGIELKSQQDKERGIKAGVVSTAQKETHVVLRAAGAATGIARSLEQVLALLDEWDIPHKRVSL